MMAKFVLQLQLQVIVIVLTFFLIVIDHYVCGASEHVRVYRGDNDTFENPNHTNCTARNAITFPDTNSGCSRCRCFGRYKTYLRSFGRCVRDNELSFLPVLKYSFMIKQVTMSHMSPIRCITHDRPHHITAAMCNQSDSSQRWIWTRYNQLLHVETLKCIQQGLMFPGKNDTWYLRLEECDMSEKKQKWECQPADNLRQKFSHSNGQEDYMYITYHGYDMILAKINTLTTWKRYQSNSGRGNEICYSSYEWCNEFINSSSVMLALDSKYQKQGQQQIANFSMGKNCSVNGLEVWDDHYWKHLDHHEFRENIFAISNTMTLADKFLKWNFTRAPSNWTNLIMKLNFNCSGCVLIKLKYSPADYPTSCATTVSSSEAAPTKSPTPATSATTAAESSDGIVTTSHPPTRSKEKQEGESSSVVGIVVGVLVAIVVLCGIILGYFCYKRRKSRLNKTSSNVEINDKGKSSGDTLNPIYSSEENKINPSLSNDGGIYQEPDGNTNAASQECDLYEPGGDHEYDYAKVEQKNKPGPSSEELEYDYAKTDDIKSAVQRAPVRGNDYQDTVIKNKNVATDANEDKEIGNDAGPLYQTLEDETAPVYQTLESE